MPARNCSRSPGVAAATTCSSTPGGQGRSFPPRASRPQCLHPSGPGPLRHTPNNVIQGQGKSQRTAPGSASRAKMSRASTAPGSRPLPPTLDSMEPGGKRGVVAACACCCAPPPLPPPFPPPPPGPLPFAPWPRPFADAASAPPACWPCRPCCPSSGGGGGGTPSCSAGSGLSCAWRAPLSSGWRGPVRGVAHPGAGVGVPPGLSAWRPRPWYAPRASASARAASTAARIIMSDCLATARSSVMIARTMAPRSSRGAPARVRLRTAAR
eukprot:1650551-Pleurochrysis_carterae.AAC.1